MARRTCAARVDRDVRLADRELLVGAVEIDVRRLHVDVAVDLDGM